MEEELILNEDSQKFDEENHEKCHELENQRFLL
jgi:hypothetical protein